MGGGVHQLHIPVRTGGVFYFPWHRHQIEGTDGFECLLRKTLAKRGKRNCQSSEAKRFPQWDSNTGPSGRQSNALTHSATAPPFFLQSPAMSSGIRIILEEDRATDTTSCVKQIKSIREIVFLVTCLDLQTQTARRPNALPSHSSP